LHLLTHRCQPSLQCFVLHLARHSRRRLLGWFLGLNSLLLANQVQVRLLRSELVALRLVVLLLTHRTVDLVVKSIVNRRSSRHRAGCLLGAAAV